MTTKRKTMLIYLDAAQKAALKKLSEKTRVPMAVYVREAIDELLKKHKYMRKNKYSR